MQITTRSSYAQCVEAINESVKEFLLDQPEIAESVNEDEIWADMAASILTEASPVVAQEVCRTQLGWVPQSLRHLWVQREQTKREVDARRRSNRAEERAKTRADAAVAALEAERRAVKDNTCPKCFTVKSPSGACNC